MQRVLLINQGNTDNLGDKAINLSFRSLLEKYGSTVDFAGFAQTDEQFIDKIDKKKNYKLKSFVKKRLPNFLIWFFKYRKKIKKELNSLDNQNYDLVILGGGQLIKSKNVFAYCFLSWITLLRRKGYPIFVVGVGADDQFSFIEKVIYQKCLAQVNNIYVRDKESQAILNRIFNISAQPE
ncbi:polysaccharide pyruvyl transferase family protein [Tetragenococcus halophilus]|uniref:polysaccharide pyruvyl transferase family protein n=1 Tax=Tetragenococcus halophilus TaxID=51669 RepID=UPI0030C9C164